MIARKKNTGVNQDKCEVKDGTGLSAEKLIEYICHMLVFKDVKTDAIM